MDRKEFAMFCSAIRTYYPKEKILPNEQAMELWYRHLSDLPYETASLVLSKWVAVNKWSPTIADIREMALSVTGNDIPEWSEAWEEVRMAIRQYGMYNPEGAYESMSELTREVAKRIGFVEICLSENPEASRANFRMAYENAAKNKRMSNQLPPDVAARLEKISLKALESRN